jgi:glucose dehydrogenase
MRMRIHWIRSIVTLAAASMGIAFAQNDWPAFGRDPGAQRYSPLTQINAGNAPNRLPLARDGPDNRIPRR